MKKQVDSDPGNGSGRLNTKGAIYDDDALEDGRFTGVRVREGGS